MPATIVPQQRRILDRVLSSAETAVLLGINERTLRRMVNEGEGHERVQVSQRRFGFRESAIEHWLANRVCKSAEVA
jgi:predicted DNA-binding transcriptional regulator AlpA